MVSKPWNGWGSVWDIKDVPLYVREQKNKHETIAVQLTAG